MQINNAWPYDPHQLCAVVYSDTDRACLPASLDARVEALDS